MRNLDQIDSSEIGVLEIADAEEYLPAGRERCLKRKPNSGLQRARKSQRRSENKMHKFIVAQSIPEDLPEDFYVALKPKAPPAVRPHSSLPPSSSSSSHAAPATGACPPGIKRNLTIGVPARGK